MLKISFFLRPFNLENIFYFSSTCFEVFKYFISCHVGGDYLVGGYLGHQYRKFNKWFLQYCKNLLFLLQMTQYFYQVTNIFFGHDYNFRCQISFLGEKKSKKQVPGFLGAIFIQVQVLFFWVRLRLDPIYMYIFVKRYDLVTSNDLRPLLSQHYIYIYTCIFIL